MSFTVYPAIDVRAGRVVRLRQGDYGRETQYDDDPFALAMRYADAGARWLHLVDLDAARDGGYALGPLLERIAADGRLRVQTGGGVRGVGDVQRILGCGASRVVVGSLAVADAPLVAGWFERFGGEAIVVACDVRQDRDGHWWPATHGWTRNAAIALQDLAVMHAAAGMRHLLCTDISRDGTMAGPNFELYAQLLRGLPWLQLQASGGAREAGDVARAIATGCSGIVLGKALLEGRIRLDEALAC